MWLSEERKPYDQWVTKAAAVPFLALVPARRALAVASPDGATVPCPNHTASPCLLRAQVLSYGRLGLLGRNGWYCKESDVERWVGLAGWRGLRDAHVAEYFNYSFIAFEESWGPNQPLLANLGLAYNVEYVGADKAAGTIKARLDADVPVFFYLWTPHPLNARYSLNRIQLPTYSAERFGQGRSDYPIDVLEKAGSKRLAELAPDVATLYSRYQITNDVQEAMLVTMDIRGLSVAQAVCEWMRQEESRTIWQEWLPSEHPACSVGSIINGSDCQACPAGSGSLGGSATACTLCAPGNPCPNLATVDAASPRIHFFLRIWCLDGSCPAQVAFSLTRSSRAA